MVGDKIDKIDKRMKKAQTKQLIFLYGVCSFSSVEAFL